jgi:ribosomal 30S subunit maturation factor RimM
VLKKELKGKKWIMKTNEETKKETLEKLQGVMSWMYRELRPCLDEQDYAELGVSCDKVFDDIEKLVG